MFTHIMLGAQDLEASRTFYDAALGALGVGPGVLSNETRYFYRTPTGVFAISVPIDGEEATHANGGTVSFRAHSEAQVDAFYAAGLANGGSPCVSGPNHRVGSIGPVYLAWIRDPLGNKLCVLYKMNT